MIRNQQGERCAKNNPWREVTIRLVVIFAASLLTALNLKSFVRAGDLFPGGFTGLARLILRCFEEFWGINLPFTPINLFINAIPAVVSFKLVGKRFTLFSCLSIVFTSILTDMVPVFEITDDMLLIAVFGGLLNGVALSLYLQVRVTSGGTDFIAIALSERKNIDAWNYILLGNVILLAIAGYLFGWDRALYSIIFQFCSTQVVRAWDPVGNRVTLLIITNQEKAPLVYSKIQMTHHTATLFEGTGLYNGEHQVMIYSVVQNSQIRRLVREVKLADPKAFTNILHTDKLMGNFYIRPRD